jgi:steroid 5-alpha reductase family enzyme
MLLHIVFTLGVALAAVLIFMAIAFIIGQRLRRYDVADIAWGLVFIIIAVSVFSYGGAHTVRPLIIGALIAVWGLRLAAQIFIRFRRKNEEDHRYVVLREQYAKHPILLPYLKIFVVQGLLALVITMPMTVSSVTSPSGLNYLDAVGITIWILGFFFETLGDAQLAEFLNDHRNKGKLMMTGLWKYTRHPNYFGEVSQWWGIGILALSAPWGWLGLIGAVTITTLILFVSGIPLLEKSYAGRKDWEEYKSRTSIFLPWFAKRSSS